MDDVIKRGTVLDESDKGGSRVNNKVHYDGVDGHRGGDIDNDYNGQGEYGSGNFASAFLRVVVVFGGSQEAVST
jgi:hypothetical protein